MVTRFMRRFIVTVMAISMMVAFVGCGDSEKKDSKDNKENVNIEQGVENGESLQNKPIASGENPWEIKSADSRDIYIQIVSNMPDYVRQYLGLDKEYYSFDYIVDDYTHTGTQDVILVLSYFVENDKGYDDTYADYVFLRYDEVTQTVSKFGILPEIFEDNAYACKSMEQFCLYSWTADVKHSQLDMLAIENGNLYLKKVFDYDFVIIDPAEYDQELYPWYGYWETTPFVDASEVDWME